MTRRHYYMLRGGMSKIMKSKSLLRVDIMWNFLVMMGRRLFWEW